MKFPCLVARLLQTALAVLILLSVSSISLAEEPKFRNPNPKLKSLSATEEARLATIKLGAPPVYSEQELKKITGGGIVIHQLSDDGKKSQYEAIGTIDATPAEVMDFMKNYPAKVGLFPHLEFARPVWEGNLAKVDMRLKIAFNRISYLMHFLHYQDKVIEFEFISGDIKDSHGIYKFFPYGDGKQTLMVYNVISDPGIPLPDFIKDLLTKSSMPKIYKSIRKGVILQRQGKLPENTALANAKRSE